MPRRRFDGVSGARTEFVRDVSDGSRPVYRRLLFLLVSYGPLANSGHAVAVAIGAAVCTQDSLIFDTFATKAAEHE